MFLAITIALAGVETSQAAERSDRETLEASEIRAAIVADLDDMESLNANNINVMVDDGLVVLSGTVSSLMDQRRASRVAKRIRDVRAVINQLIVRPQDRSDDEVRNDVIMRIRVNDSLQRPEIAIAVDRGKVAITGQVDSLAEKQLAEIAAAGVSGVTAIDNQLTVGWSSERSDQELREEIAGLITNSVYFDNVSIDVRVEEHVAYLSGTVGSAAQRDQLQRTAEIWGVVEVNVDNISVDSDLVDETQRERRFANVSDSTIKRALQSVFLNDPVVFVAADTITADVASGTVTLSGSVNRLRTKTKAEKLAMDVVGVVRVNNELEVKYDGRTPPDSKLILLAQQALLRSPYLDRREIRVHCQRAHVSLYGVVDSDFEKNFAGWLVGGLPGVVHVNNALAVERKWEEKSDQQIQEDLTRKLDTTLFEKSNSINVRVTDGVAILSGTVDTWRQWQAALDLAIEAGARHPHNMINVRYHPPHGASRIYVPQ